MKLRIGEQIRKMRDGKGMTQEQLASSLGVTSQAISRWERGDGYPDIEMLPAIANYFHVSVDTLFGFDRDRSSRISLILSEAAKSDTAKAIDILRNAADEFPSEPKILLALIRRLTEMQQFKSAIKTIGSDDTLEYDYESNRKNPLIAESIRILKRLMTLEMSPDDHAEMVLRLIILCAAVGETAEAEALSLNESPIGGSREFLLTNAYPLSSETRRAVTAGTAFGLLRMFKLTAMSALRRKDGEYNLSVLNAIIDLYRALFPEGVCGPENCDMMHLYMRCAAAYERQGMCDKAEECVHEARENSLIYEELKAAGSFSYPAGIAEGIKLDKLPEQVNISFDELFRELPETLRARVGNISNKN